MGGSSRLAGRNGVANERAPLRQDYWKSVDMAQNRQGTYGVNVIVAVYIAEYGGDRTADMGHGSIWLAGNPATYRSSF